MSGSHVYVGMPGIVTTITYRVTCGRCELVIAARHRRPDQPHVSP